MILCPNCQNQMEDNAVFCANCGANLASEQQPPMYGNVPPYQANQYQPAYDPYDHTAEFDAKDVSDNKVISMLVYLMGAIGIFLALLASNTSPYVAFHVRQALKILVVQILGALCAMLLCWTVIVPFAYGILMFALAVIKIICFFQICSGQAKEPAIIRNLKFLR